MEPHRWCRIGSYVKTPPYNTVSDISQLWLKKTIISNCGDNSSTNRPNTIQVAGSGEGEKVCWQSITVTVNYYSEYLFFFKQFHMKQKLLILFIIKYFLYQFVDFLCLIFWNYIITLSSKCHLYNICFLKVTLQLYSFNELAKLIKVFVTKQSAHSCSSACSDRFRRTRHVLLGLYVFWMQNVQFFLKYSVVFFTLYFPLSRNLK